MSLKDTPGIGDVPEVPDETPEQSPCPGCGLTSEWGLACPHCVRKFGSHLAKALADPFDFAIGLKSGVVLRFTGYTADVQGEWIKLPRPEEVRGLPYTLERGLQVRLDEIAWVADAPNGS